MTSEDIDLIAQSRISVAHCPTPFARYGAVLESPGAYCARGINIGIGTNTTPHNMLDEVRWVCVLGKVTDGNLDTVMTADVFDVATVGGAPLLGRNDIGHLAVDAKATSCSSISITGPCDPLRVLLFHAAERAVRDVICRWPPCRQG